MSKDLSTYIYNDQNIRVVSVEGEPWFVGKDVANILGYSNSRKAIADHVDEEDKAVAFCDTLVPTTRARPHC